MNWVICNVKKIKKKNCCFFLYIVCVYVCVCEKVVFIQQCFGIVIFLCHSSLLFFITGSSWCTRVPFLPFTSRMESRKTSIKSHEACIRDFFFCIVKSSPRCVVRDDLDILFFFHPSALFFTHIYIYTHRSLCFQCQSPVYDVFFCSPFCHYIYIWKNLRVFIFTPPITHFVVGLLFKIKLVRRRWIKNKLFLYRWMIYMYRIYKTIRIEIL